MIVIVVSNTIKCFFCFFSSPDNNQSLAYIKTHGGKKAETEWCSLTHSLTHSLTQRLTQSHARRQKKLNGNQLQRQTHTHIFLARVSKFLSATSRRVTLYCTALQAAPEPTYRPPPPPSQRSRVYTWAGSQTAATKRRVALQKPMQLCRNHFLSISWVTKSWGRNSVLKHAILHEASVETRMVCWVSLLFRGPLWVRMLLTVMILWREGISCSVVTACRTWRSLDQFSCFDTSHFQNQLSCWK